VFKFDYRIDKWNVCAVSLTAIMALGFSEADAGLFDWKPFQRKPPASQAKPAASASNRVIHAGGFEPVADSAGPMSSPINANPVVPIEVYEDSARPAPAMKMPCERTFDCFNCGEEDGCQSCLRKCRKKCNQTWYPRVAPYCQTGWGYTQPCWRRTEDTNNCPPVRLPNSTSWPAPAPAVEPAPALAPAMESPDAETPDAETLPESPVPPRATSSRR
jgi:hypothetical protein